MIIMSVHNSTLFRPNATCRGPEHLDSGLRVTHLQFHQPRVLILKSCCKQIAQTPNLPTMLCESRKLPLRFADQGSMTYRIPEIVMEVSAMLVARTILRHLAATPVQWHWECC